MNQDLATATEDETEDLIAMEAKLAELEAQEAAVDKELQIVQEAQAQELGKVGDFERHQNQI